jgi:hypothetical protein
VKPRRMVAGGALLALALTAAGCVNGKPQVNFPPETGRDLTAEIACISEHVLAGEVDPLAIGLSCGIQEAALAVDLFDALTNKPTASPAAQNAVAAWRAGNARP